MSRTVWFAKDADFYADDCVVRLGEEFGPAGPLVLDFLLCTAKKQHAAGRVCTGYHAISRGCFLSDVDLARRIVTAAIETGVLEAIETDDASKVVARFTRWAAHQEQAGAATRQARHRTTTTGPDGATPESATGALREGTVTDRDNPLHTVTGRDRTDQTVTDRDTPLQGVTDRDPYARDRTGQDNTATAEGSNAKRNLSSSDSGEPDWLKRPELAHLANRLALLMRQNDPGAKPKPASQAWFDPLRLLVDRDGRSPREVEAVICWSQADEFWRCNIHSPASLRDKFSQLALKMQAAEARTPESKPALAHAGDLSRFDRRTA